MEVYALSCYRFFPVLIEKNCGGQGHAELIALQRLDETSAQLQKQVISCIHAISMDYLLTDLFYCYSGKLFGGFGMHGAWAGAPTALLWR